MIISFNTGKIETKGGGGNLQQKKVTVTENGLDVIVPDAGYDGFSTVYVKTNVGEGGSSYKDFSVIGYDDETSIMLNNEIDDDIAYSKSLYDAWNPENTSAERLYQNNTKLVYAPAINTSNVTSAESMCEGCVVLEQIPYYDLSNCTDITNMFRNCKVLKTIDLSRWNTSNISKMGGLFEYCYELTAIKGIGDIDISRNSVFSSLFNGCSKLTELDLSQWVLTKTQCLFSYLFAACNGLVSLNIQNIDFNNVTSITGIFSNTNNIENLIFGYNFKFQLSLTGMKKITVESLLSILNGLYDFTGNGETPTSSQGKLTLGSTNLAKLTDEQKAIATDKGWTLS